MSDEELQSRAEERMAAFLDKPEHKQKAHGKPEHVEDDVAAAVEADATAGPPDWAKAGKDAPHGWHRAGDTFEED